MSGKLIVKNFGPIINATIDLKKVMVFIGPQASGKSTIAKLISIFCDSDWQLPSFWRSRSYNEFFMERLFHLGLNSFLKKNTEVYFDSPTGSVKVNYEDAVPKIGKKNIEVIYFPSERNFISLSSGKIFNLLKSDIPISRPIINFGAEFERARAKLGKLPIGFINVEYRYENEEDRVYYGKSRGQFVKLSESASGLQSLIPLQLVLHASYNSGGAKMFIVEEPELNLFPTAQHELIKELIEKGTWRKSPKGESNELLITTHSPYTLSTLNTLLFAFDAGKKSPAMKTKVAKIIPQKYWIDLDDFAAYHFENGTAKSIVGKETGLISENELDSASLDINDDFNRIMEIYRKS
jgi:AAA ATPase domain